MTQFKSFLTIVLVSLAICSLNGQAADRWQQAIDYKMIIDMDVDKNQYQGQQTIKYTNNSPDALDRVFYHLYFNAFQPGSMMDVRSLTIKDPDRRVGDRISKLTPEEVGYQIVKSLTQDGKPVKYETVGTILEVELDHAIQPGATTELKMTWEAQVPLQIRRSGRDNKEGIRYSMAQWYPKLSEYDYQGWHANPYVGREFHGVWGDFDVKINIADNYSIASTGVLQNPADKGYGYSVIKERQQKKRKGKKKLEWHFVGKNIHDFMWAADPDYKQIVSEREDGLAVRYFYQPGEKTSENWEKLPGIMNDAFDYINTRFGQYPYPVYSFIQGGDGGMEYPMATLITGERSLGSLVGVSVHELMHSWYQMILGTNESLYSWMDEGFTTFATNEVMAYLRSKGHLPAGQSDNPQARSYTGYKNLAISGSEEPMSTHSDHYNTNFAYGQAAYSKGAVFMNQLGYVIGADNLDKGILQYFDTWKFKHPNPNDFIRVMEKQSGMELDWYKEYMVYTTRTIDYAVGDVSAKDDGAVVRLENKGGFPMPIDLFIETKDGQAHIFNIPLRIMRGAKKAEFQGIEFHTAEDWAWTHPTYDLEIPIALDNIKTIIIDPSTRLADIDYDNNVKEFE